MADLARQLSGGPPSPAQVEGRGAHVLTQQARVPLHITPVGVAGLVLMVTAAGLLFTGRRR